MLGQFAFDIELARRAGQKGSGKLARIKAVARYGASAMREGRIPAWWWLARYKPDPRVMFGADWPEDERVDPQWHMARQSLIHGRYRNSPWYPAFARGISWYQLCRERESMTAPDRDLKRKAFSSDDC